MASAQSPNCYSLFGLEDENSEHCCIRKNNLGYLELVKECWGITPAAGRRALNEAHYETSGADEIDGSLVNPVSEEEPHDRRQLFLGKLFCWNDDKTIEKDGHKLEYNHKQSEELYGCMKYDGGFTKKDGFAPICGVAEKECILKTVWHDKHLAPDHYDMYCCIKPEYGFSLDLLNRCFGIDTRPKMQGRRRLMKN